MTPNTQYNIVAGLSGAVAASWKTVLNIAQAPVIKYTYQIDWAETFQISWKAAVGAVVGLSIKWLWDKLFNRKSKKARLKDI